MRVLTPTKLKGVPLRSGASESLARPGRLGRFRRRRPTRQRRDSLDAEVRHHYRPNARKPHSSRPSRICKLSGSELQLLSYAPAQCSLPTGREGRPPAGSWTSWNGRTSRTSPIRPASYWQCSEIPTRRTRTGITGRRFAIQPWMDFFKKRADRWTFLNAGRPSRRSARSFYDQVYWLGLWQDPDYWALGPRLQNVHPSAGSPFYDIAQWQVDLNGCQAQPEFHSLTQAILFVIFNSSLFRDRRTSLKPAPLANRIYPGPDALRLHRKDRPKRTIFADHDDRPFLAKRSRGGPGYFRTCPFS